MQNDMRNRLIQLIKHCTSCEECFDEDIVDHLIANGVIVPPVKVGQAIWSSEPFKDGKIREGYINVLFCDDSGVYSFYSGFKGVPAAFEFLIEDIGKTVFLTREAAEQALKERENNA